MGRFDSAGVAEMFRVRPLTARSEGIWQDGDHALIGVSTGNSYFSTHRLATLLRWAQHQFRRVDVICADTQIDTMYRASGYEPAEAARRAKRRVSATRRRIRGALRASAVVGGRVQSHLLSDFLSDESYMRVREQVREALRTETPFTRACEKMVDGFLANNSDTPECGDTERRDAQWRAGMTYVSNEMPFLIDTPGILGVPSSLSVYHLLPPAVEELYCAAGVPAPATRQGFAVVTPRVPDPNGREK